MRRSEKRVLMGDGDSWASTCTKRFRLEEVPGLEERNAFIYSVERP